MQNVNVETCHCPVSLEREILVDETLRRGSAASLRAHLVSAGCLLALWLSSAACAQTPMPAGEDLHIQADIPSLKEAFSSYFTVGAAIWPGDISGPHSELLKKHFNSITAENAMKWAVIEPTEGNLNFAPADALVGFAKSNHMLIRGHTLCWHKQVPPWLFKDASGNAMTPTPENKALLLRRLENHIRGVVSHYK